MIRRVAVAVAASTVSLVAAGVIGRRLTDRLLHAPRVLPEEAALGPALDALGGEVIRLRARDGVRLAGRWLPAEPGDAEWVPDPHEAILLLHGYMGSIAPDLVEYGPYLRRTAGVLGLDFRGHGASDDGPSTFGLLESEDVAGALAWLGERGVVRVALVGTSMGGTVAIVSVAVLGDGTLAGADAEPAAPRHVEPAPRPRIIAVVADSVAPELETPIAARLPGPATRFLAARLFDGAARKLGADPRATEPARVIGLLEPVPVLLIHGDQDATVPIAEGRRLAGLAGPSTRHWIVPGADHSQAHATAPQDYERRTTDFLRMALATARPDDPGPIGSGPIIAGPDAPSGDPIDTTPTED
ncbi:MAG: alpha/beta hydrolase [Chloroflexota bacterium]|nr:alpha/beta hydrolase [Chloroflexota bacterium]MDH5243321.1 alpha/beta hydrolase [Chloroflexota bacterium]